jgi:hypothetical protein
VKDVDEFVDHIMRGGLIDAGELRLTKTTLGKRGGPRYLIYLPLSRNYLWQALHGRKVRVFIQPLAEETKES